MEKITYEYSTSKNLKLLNERGIGFEDIIVILNTKGALAVLDNPNQVKYPGQKICVVDINSYLYLVPFERRSNKILLKTVYPSRKFTRLHRAKLKERELWICTGKTYLMWNWTLKKRQ